MITMTQCFGAVSMYRPMLDECTQSTHLGTWLSSELVRSEFHHAQCWQLYLWEPEVVVDEFKWGRSGESSF